MVVQARSDIMRRSGMAPAALADRFATSRIHSIPTSCRRNCEFTAAASLLTITAA
jgi:hypothetical protein